MNRTFNTILPAVIAAFLLVASPQQGRSQQTSSTTKSKAGTAVQNDSTPGKIAKFNDRGFVTDSNITEDSSGKIGVGTTAPASPLTVQGMIETTLGGYKFPDGTTQTTAGLASVFRDSTLKGNGTQTSPLGIAFPLRVDTFVQFGSVIEVSNGNVASHGITATGGVDGGVGVRGYGGNANLPGYGVLGVGGNSSIFSGGFGVGGGGGSSDTGTGGVGVSGGGGFSRNGTGGEGVSAGGGSGFNGNGGNGVRSIGGIGYGSGHRGGNGIETFPGEGFSGAPIGLAAKFNGNVQVTGVLSKAGGSFKIDHPLDPENKYLSHSFVESPDMMNIYNGNITTDGTGRAVVELPEWFDALNKDFRYQLTVLGTFAQAIVAEEVKDNHFVIQTNAPGVKVSWQVTGIRQDAWANKNRIPVEEVKPEKERGFYLHPEAFGKAEERGINWALQPEMMREMKQRQLEAEQKRQPKQ